MSEHQTTKVSRATAAWLASQSAAWVDAGLIDAERRSRILATYEIEPAERRSLLALTLLGALMFGIGALLLIGYNWERLPADGKIAICISAVVLAFAASAVSYARQARVAGETLAFLGVGLFGGAIWLIAHVLEIRGEAADAFMWWTVGAVACAWLVTSRAVGVGAAGLLFVWALAAGFTTDRPQLAFLALWTATVGAAYWIRSSLMLVPAALAAVAWISWTPEGTQPQLMSIGAAALMGCASYAIGFWHAPSSTFGRAWMLTALATIGGTLVPLLLTPLHVTSYYRPVTWGSLVVLLLPLSVIATMVIATRRSPKDVQSPARVWRFIDASVMAMAATVAVWLGVAAAGVPQSTTFAYAATVAYSLVALALSISCIHKALASDSATDLTFGIGFALVFLLMRWASLVDSMLWSGTMLVAASGGFFAIARMWSARRRQSRSILTMATGEVR
jgi:uncharacterized membrane protein